METAERICKRFHSYLNSGEYSGRVSSVTGEKLEIETTFGTVSVLNAGALQPFSCFVSGIQPFTAMVLKTGMDVLLDQRVIAIPDADFSLDITLAEDVDLTIRNAVEGQKQWAAIPFHKRMEILERFVQLAQQNEEKIARTMAIEGQLVEANLVDGFVVIKETA